MAGIDVDGNSTGGTLMKNSTVVIEQTANYIKLAIPKQSRRTHTDLKYVEAKGLYEVAKSNVYEWAKENLSDGSEITVMRRMPIPYKRQMEIYEAAKASGLKVSEPTQNKAERLTPDGRPMRINIAELQ